MVSTQRHVARFFNMIDSEGRTVELARRFLRPRSDNDRANKVIAAVEQWVIAQAKKRYEGSFDFRNPSERAVADARDAAAALHLLMAHSARRVRKSDAYDSTEIARLLEALEPDFPERMLVELRERERRSATFAGDLGRARAWVVGTALSLQQSLRQRESEYAGNPVSDGREEEPSIIFKENSEKVIGIGVIVILVVSIAVWWFDQVNEEKGDD